MTTTETEMGAQQGHEPSEPGPTTSSALRRSAAIRVAVSVFLAGALTAAAVVAVWTPLPPKSDVIGYPIVAVFNPNNYAYAYYLAVGLFPIAGLLIFLGLTRIGPRVGLAVPPSRGGIRPLANPGEVETSFGVESSLGVRRFTGRVRVALLGLVLGLEVGVASNRLWLGLVLVTIGYSLLVALGSIAIGRFMSSQWTSEARLAAVNSLGAALTVGGLSLLSAHTAVRVLSNNSIDPYPWFPAWLGVPLSAALFAWILFSVRRAGPARVAAVERRAVLLIAAPVALFVLVAALPGDAGQINLYEVGQELTEAKLVLHGWLPWRDVVVPHGLLHDVIPIAVGWRVFGNSYWGGIAGLFFIFGSLTILGTYWLLAYLVGRSWPVLLIGALIYLGTWVGAEDPRFILWPLILLLLASVLKRFTPVRAAGLGCLTVAQAIATPEMLAAAPIVAAVVVAYEWYWRPPSTPLARAFPRTIWFGIAAFASAGAFAIYMASRGGLGAFISVTLDFFSAKFNQGVPPNQLGVTPARFDFIALAPVAALLVSFVYAVVRLRSRRPFLLADWPMAAAALYVLVYYAKFLTFMDVPHAYEPFVMATPLMIYIVYRALAAVERWIRTRAPSRNAVWLTTHPVGIAVLICFVILFWGPLHTAVETAPAKFQPTAPQPAIPGVGYAIQYDSAAVDDLRRIVNAYLGPHDRLLDITNEPGLFYDWLDRDPSSRWFAPDALTSTAQLQRSLLDDLRRAPPKLIVFDDTDTTMIGLPGISGVPENVFLYLVSRWILAHYRPLLESHGRTIYALPGLPSVSSLHLALHQQPVTIGVPFGVQQCYWGFAPTFLTGPGEPPLDAQTVPARATVARPAEVTFTGWAGDLRALQPAREVIATFKGRIVGRATPHIERPDVPKAGLPAGFVRSGFQLSIPTWANAASSLRMFAVGRDGSVAELATLTTPPPGGTARISGRTVTLQPSAVTGHVDGEAATGPLVQIEPPAGSTWADYRWLEVDAPNYGGFLRGVVTLTDQRDPTDQGHMITFATLPSSPRRYIIPVSSCAQWHGYGASRLFLVSSPPQEIGGASLIR